VAESAERQYLAGLLDVLDELPVRDRELVSLVDRDMLMADGTGELYSAIRRVLEDVAEPTRADVLASLRRESAAVGVAFDADLVRQLFLELVKDRLFTGLQASRLAGEAAAEVAELHRRRRSIELLGDAVLRLHDGESAEGVGELLEQVQAVRSAGPGRGVVTFAAAVEEWARHERVPTVRTLLEPLDDATEGGLPIGGLTTLVAAPQTGKSAFAVQLAVGSLLADDGLRVTYALGEMGIQAFSRRAACVGASLLGRPLVTMHEAGIRSREARETLEDLVREIGDRLTIVEPPLTVERVDEQVRRSGAKLVVIDYLQLMVAASGENRVEQLDGIIGSLRDLAIRRQAAVLVISSMAKATGTGSRIGQFARGTGEADYASELLYLGVPDERTDEHGVRAVRWECRKARNLPQVDVELRFDGSRQTFSAAAVPFSEFQRFAPGGPL
jgi:KaiC/GvpD/RAD55 family RecA-like ATPase